MQSGDLVDDKCEEGRHDEGVAGAGDDVDYLDVKLSVVVVDPAAIDDAGIDPIKANDIVGCKKTIEDETDHASDTVLREDVHAVINTNPELNYVIVRIKISTNECRTYSLFRS